MTPDQFFAKFALLSETPNAIQKMRELILDLAVSGRLMTCPRNSTTVNADFSLSKLKDISVKITDGTHKTPHYVESGVPFVSVKDFSGGKLDLSDTRFITKDEHTLLFRRCDPRRGDILLGRIGTLGKAVVVDVDIEFSLFVSAALIRPRLDVLDSDFLRFALNSPFVTDQFNHIKVGGATHTNKLNLGDLGGIQIPLPPLAEQKRIVAKVDELMALCDQLESQQKQRETKKATLVQAALTRFTDAPTPANLEFLFHKSYAIDPAELRKTILTLAVRGKLVAQNFDDEPASELLNRVSRELPADKRRRQAAPLPPLSSDLLQYDVPESWTWARFRDVAIIASNLVNPNDFLDFVHLAPDNIEKGNGVLLSCATVREDKVISSNHRFYPGQIVYSKIRPNLAKVVVVDFEGLCSADMYPIDALVHPKYLQYYMLSDSFLVQAVRTDTRVAMPKINQLELNAIAVPVPPLAEQKRIVAKVEELMALVDKLEAQLAASKDAGAKLMEAVVAAIAAAA